MSLETTLARARSLMAPLGITRVANVTGLDRIGIPVVAVFRPNSRSLVAAQGKGLSLAAAQASGLMESIESHHAEHVDLPLLRASYSELSRSRDVVNVSLLPRPAVSTFGADVPILWVEGYDLMRDRAIWVPLETVHLDYRVPLPTGSGCFFASSNGLASGNTPLEAINHGIFELVERDANTLAHLAPKAWKQERRVDLASVDDPDCRLVLDRFENAGIAVVVWDVTSDVGIASFLCCVADRNPNHSRPLRPIAGSGCHPRREIALLRALTEAAQGRLTTIAGSRDDLNASLYDRSDALARIAVFFNEVAESIPNRLFAATPTRDLPTFLDDFQLTLEALARAGVRQVVAVDLSRADVGLPVVRIVVPGLEAMSEAPHYTPGPRARRLLAEAS